jgi:drug/metabolite transporter (DMT)-like permease
VNLRGLYHLLVVYIVWGSTYLAIRVAVREGSGFPPFIMVAMRVLAASVILLAWGKIAKSPFRMKRRLWLTLGASAVLLWVGGNGLVSWAEQRAHSGYAALLVSTLPIWTAIIEAIIDRKPPSWRLVAALLVGFAGVGVLNWPVIREGSLGDVFAAVALFFAPLLWGIGSIIQRRNPVPVNLEVSSGYQQMIGGVAILILSFLMREPVPHPIPQAWAAWGYLIIFGSVFAYTSFVKALHLLPTNIVMTYAYVNPVIAVFLGWTILGEPITLWTLGGTVLIVTGVMGVFHEKRRSGRETPPSARA